MNNEIKEILEFLSNENYYIQDIDCKFKRLYLDEVKTLLDYITNLQEEKDKYKLRCYKAKKMIFDNYGVLDKYEIEILEDILDGKSDE